ncbi:PREDICTED: UDP-glucuronate:xylan alpha-glucuronosyltransferase 2 isoform X1 [Fragaria vesca subsp. vesca]|uniref:UDP-glucuronate:xylan alpha-glucuronosyltransferase 2 isoform X1 n=1 Tax=Fragaria vesca subsp. vesca TaxID=101020 RepID=UPI0002C36BFB|nr:PREDICTED: UDP-glucuronate:xylan alpha-glucuronosyltransferase 2 isoform X1 [Fragaria vesca subsp. vesca]
MIEGNGFQKLSKIASSKALVIRVNLVFLALFFVVYAGLLLQPSATIYYQNAAVSLLRCSFSDCHQKGKVDDGVKMMKQVVKETKEDYIVTRREGLNASTKMEVPSFLEGRIRKGIKIGMVNMEEDDVSEWKRFGKVIPVRFNRVSEFFKWEDLFPEWIDEEEETDVPFCPEIPMPEYRNYDRMNLVVAKLPCKYPEEGWNREVFRLQVHLIAANLAVKRGAKDRNLKTKVVFWSKCRPMLEIFRCSDLVKQEGDWWLYEADMAKLKQKVSLPVGSCNLALPLWGQGIDEVYDLSKIQGSTKNAAKEAYVTVLHTTGSYVCGAITLAQSLLQTGTKRDLVLLLDDSISAPKRDALAAAGWKLRFINRIRNPKAQNGTYNEYNYSKFRLWQLTDYDKVIFIDADIVVLRNLDLLFHFPQMSATGNDIHLFNSGVMIIEPSNCTFQHLMDHRDDIVSYNGGDQGFLNEIFVWWHRLPRRVNYLKNFWSNTTLEQKKKDGLFGAHPPKLYSIHYLGLKPWLCYRDYDCNWDIQNQFVYASDAAHRRWWEIHDKLDEKLQKFCLLTKERRTNVNWERRKARKLKFPNGHWKINITDPRRKHTVEDE